MYEYMNISEYESETKSEYQSKYRSGSIQLQSRIDSLYSPPASGTFFHQLKAEFYTRGLGSGVRLCLVCD